MKQIKKPFAALLALMLLLSLGVGAAAQGSVVISGDSNDGKIHYTFYADGTLEFDGTGGVYSDVAGKEGPLYPYLDEIKTMIFNEGVTSFNGEIFWFCENLEYVSFSKTFLRMDEDGFASAVNLKRFTVDAANPNFAADDNGCLFNRDMTELVKYTTGSSAAEYVIPDGVSVIGATAFHGCSALESIVIPNSVTTIGGAAFSGCSALESIVIPNSVTTVGGAAFSGCKALRAIEIPSGVTSFGYSVFFSCEALQDVTLPEHFTEIPPYTFGQCFSMTSFHIPANVTKICLGAFFNCWALRDIELPDSITEIGNSAFAYCYSLQSVVLPKNLTEISERAFYGTKALELIAIPAGVRSIGKDAFGGYSPNHIGNAQKTDVYVRMSEKTWNDEVSVGEGNDHFLTLDFHFLPDDAQWIPLPYGDKGLQNGDWYLDVDAFMELIGRGKSPEEKAEARALLERHVVFSFNPGGGECLYKYDFTDLPSSDGAAASGTVILPLDLTLGREDAFPYDYNALQQCVKQYNAPAVPDEPEPPAVPDEPEPPAEEDEGWFQRHIVGPLRSVISAFLSFFRRLFGKKK